MDIDGNLRCPRCLAAYDGEHCAQCGYSECEAVHVPGHLEPETILVNRYLLGAVLGVGGFGVTYAAWDLTLDLPVAIKEYFPSSVAVRDTSASDDVTAKSGERNALLFDAGRKRFLREARMLAALDGCPSVVSVKDCFEVNQTAYLAMEFVHGASLTAYAEIQGGTIESSELLRLMRSPIDALAQVHQHGLLHRDISPSNLMRQLDGQIKLIDFGAATILTEDGYAEDATMILHRGYAAPEQFETAGKLGPWTDVYGICATMYALLTGEKPEIGMALPDNTVRDALRRSRLSPRQHRAIRRGLAPSWRNRIQSMPELLSALYGVPLPEELAQRKRLLRVAWLSIGCSICLCLLLLANTFVGLPVGSGLFLGLRGDGLAVLRYTGTNSAPALPSQFAGIPVRRIERSAFMDNAAIEELTIPEGIRVVGDWAFYGCDRLREVRLPDGLIDIGALAFAGCDQLAMASVPASVTRIGEAAFDRFSKALVLYGSADSMAEQFARSAGFPFIDYSQFEFEIGLDAAALVNYTGMFSDITVPTKADDKPVVVLAEGIHWPYELRRIVLPDGVEMIGDRAFEDCLSLEQVEISEGLRIIGDSAFLNCGELREIQLPIGTKSVGSWAFSCCRQLELVHLPNTMEALGAYAFERCERLVTIRLPNALKRIEEGTFSGCSDLSSLDLPAQLREIGDEAFSQCTSLTEVVIPDGTEWIGESSFSGCTSLSSVIIPASVQSIGTSAFYGCARELVLFGYAGSAAEAYAQQHDISFEDMGRWTAPSAFDYEMQAGTVCIVSYDGDAQDVVVPSYIDGHRVTKLALGALSDGAFEDCETVRSVVLPRYVSEVPIACFNHCTSLSSVRLPDGLRVIRMYAFAGCASLSEIALPVGVTQIDDGAFEDHSDGFAIISQRGSYAESYAHAEGICFQAE